MCMESEAINENIWWATCQLKIFEKKPPSARHTKFPNWTKLFFFLPGSIACLILNVYLGYLANPVCPAIPVSYHNGAVLGFSAIKTSGTKSQVKLLACVVVAESPLCLEVTAFYWKDEYSYLISFTWLQARMLHWRPFCSKVLSPGPWWCWWPRRPTLQTQPGQRRQGRGLCCTADTCPDTGRHLTQ